MFRLILTQHIFQGSRNTTAVEQTSRFCGRWEHTDARVRHPPAFRRRLLFTDYGRAGDKKRLAQCASLFYFLSFTVRMRFVSVRIPLVFVQKPLLTICIFMYQFNRNIWTISHSLDIRHKQFTAAMPCDTKYLIRDLFRMKYPETTVPIKQPMPRPVDAYFVDWKGPKRKEFREDIEIAKYSGNQKWLLYCLERFLNKYEK